MFGQPNHGGPFFTRIWHVYCRTLSNIIPLLTLSDWLCAWISIFFYATQINNLCLIKRFIGTENAVGFMTFQSLCISSPWVAVWIWCTALWPLFSSEWFGSHQIAYDSQVLLMEEDNLHISPKINLNVN